MYTYILGKKNNNNALEGEKERRPAILCYNQTMMDGHPSGNVVTNMLVMQAMRWMGVINMIQLQWRLKSSLIQQTKYDYD